MPASDIYIYMCHMFITRRVHGGFYGLDLKKGNGHLGKLDMNALDSSMIKKWLQILSPKQAKIVAHTTRVVNSCQGKVTGVVVFLTELHKSSTCSGIGCDTSS